MTYHILGRRQTTRLRYVFKLAYFKVHPPLNILTVHNWLNVKLHYSLIESTVKILNTLFLLAHLRNVTYVTGIIPSRLTGLLSLPLSISLSLFHSLYPPKLLNRSVTIVFASKTKITSFKQIYPIYQIGKFNTS
jgi:hypothetical protein